MITHNNFFTRAIAVLLLAAGVLHFIALPERFTAGTGLGVLFICIAAGQIVLATRIARKPTKQILLTAAVGNTALLMLWALTQLLPSYAGGTREPVSILQLTRKALELLAVIGTIQFLHTEKTKKENYTVPHM